MPSKKAPSRSNRAKTIGRYASSTKTPRRSKKPSRDGDPPILVKPASRKKGGGDVKLSFHGEKHTPIGQFKEDLTGSGSNVRKFTSTNEDITTLQVLMPNNKPILIFNLPDGWEEIDIF